MGQLIQEFEFQTQDAPQVKGVGNARWEPVPLASMPPTFDISIPTNFADTLSVTVQQLADTYTNYANTLKVATQNLQNASCSIGSLVENLKRAQDLAEEFAKQNNQTKMYVRALGLQPPGTITNQSQFLNEVKKAILDVGNGVGKIPQIVPVEVPLDVPTISAALVSGDGNIIEQLIEGASAGKFIGLTIGDQLQKLSNNQELLDGISASNYTATIKQIEKSGNTTRIYLSENPPFDLNQAIGKKVVIGGAELNPQNVGTFSVKEFKVVDFIDRTLLPYGAFIVIDNAKGKNQQVTSATAQFKMGVVLRTSDRVRSALQQEGYLDKGANKFLPVTKLVDVLIKYQIIGTNSTLKEKDRSIAIERLSRLTSDSQKRVGGIVLVGQAPDLPALAAKVTVLANVMDWLQPVAETLSLQAVQELNNKILNPSGISFNTGEVDLAKLNPEQNAGIKDKESVKKKILDSKVLDFKMPELESLVIKEPQPDPRNFNAWRKFTPVDLIPSLEVLGKIPGATETIETTSSFFTQMQNTDRQLQSTTGSLFAAAEQDLTSLIERGQQEIETGLADLEGKANSVQGIVGKLNEVNKLLSDMTNWIKNQTGKGRFKLDGHLIGADLNLLSNSDFIDAIESSVKDNTDPNRPTFGPPASRGVYDNQQALIVAGGGPNALSRNTRLWFGILIFIVGDDQQDLGKKLNSITNILSMDSSAIDLVFKKTPLGL